MTAALLRAADGVSHAAARLGMLASLLLVGSMLWEVVARYAFGAPTLWASDVSAMLNGAIFVLGAAWALRMRTHVRIDFLSSRLPDRVQHGVNLAFYVAALIPILAVLAWTAAERTQRAFDRGEVDLYSSWKPLLWPFYALLTAGLIVFLLQVAAEAVRHAIALRRGTPFGQGA